MGEKIIQTFSDEKPESRKWMVDPPSRASIFAKATT
jgi:hypothetical protein